MERLITLVRFFHDGGAFMYPIAVVLALGIVIAVERLVVLNSTTRTNRRDYEALVGLLLDRRFDAAAVRAGESLSDVGRIVCAGLTRLASSGRREDIEHAMEEALLDALPFIERRTQYLATFANIATLLGLLGTIVGLIGAFTAVANAEPSDKAALLSQSISVAMNTTAFGLIVAIPLLLAHSFLQGKADAIVQSLEVINRKVLNLLSGARGHAGDDDADDRRGREAGD